MLQPIYTEIQNCRNCHKCIRECPIKAIKVKDDKAVIVTERCIFCAKCIDVCPNGAKKLRNDVKKAESLIESKKRVFVSLSPSSIAEFDKNKEALLVALKRLGFSDISETSIGDSIASMCIKKEMEENEGILSKVSTSCPSVVELIKKYYPELTDSLSNIPSPLQCHSAYLRHLYGDDIGIVYIGPCVSKKLEADYTPGYPDCALTFKELRNWFFEKNINLDEIQKDIDEGRETVPEIVPKKAGIALLSVLSGGTVASLKNKKGNKKLSESSIFISGSEAIKEVFDTYENCGYIETLFCDQGCINGPGCAERKSIAKKKMLTLQSVNKRLEETDDLFIPPKDFVDEVIQKGYGILNTFNIKGNEKSIWQKFSDAQIKGALKILGKETSEDEYNCGGCGYNTCRDMAEAFLAGMAEPNMCVTKNNEEIHNKLTMLLKTIPVSTAIVNNKLQIVDCNSEFVKNFTNFKVADDNTNLMVGLPINDFVPYADLFKNQLVLKEKTVDDHLNVNNRIFKTTLFTIEENALVGVLLEDITSPTMQRETVIKNAEEVIKHSLSTVQTIASLLGENAAETEIMLNSMIEAFSPQKGETDE